MLLQAIREDDYYKVRALIESGADPNSSDDDWVQLDFLSTLKRAFIWHRLYDSTALMEAAGVGDSSIIELLLEKGADVHLKKTYGLTALMAGAMRWPTKGLSKQVQGANEEERVECLRLLINAGSEVNAHDWHGETALMYAAWAGNKACAAFLLNKGAKLNAKDDRGCTVLMYARKGRKDPETIAFLKKAGTKE